MASGFPGSIDNFTDPLANSPLNSPSHATLHSDVNDAVEKIETYMGLVKVIPTGATNGTVGATGTVTIGNAVSSVIVSGCFSSLYDDYLIRVTDVSASSDNADLQVRLRAGGTSSSTGYYYSYIYSAYTGGVNAANGNNTTLFSYIGRVHNNTITSATDISQPYLTRRTTIKGWAAGSNLAGQVAGFHDVAASYDSIEILISAGTLTGGKIRIYGYRN